MHRLIVKQIASSWRPSRHNIRYVASSANSAKKSIYLDMQSTTPVDPRVLDAMIPHYISSYGNPHSRTHIYGWESEDVVEESRAKVAKLIGSEPKEIIFTSGATESNNTAIKGVAHFYKSDGKDGKPKKNHIVTTVTEHKCVLDSCRFLEQQGFQVTYIPVQTNGLIDLEVLSNAITPETILVTVMAVNNEIGVIQPLEKIGKICRGKNVFFHTDGAQAVGKIPMDVNKMNIDLLSISGHKIYGPKGIGGLFVRRRPRVRIEALISGGGQERGMRSGTLPTPLIVGMGKACEVAGEELERDNQHIKKLHDKLYQGIMEQIPHCVLNGDKDQRFYGCTNISFAYVEGESLLMALKEIALSSGSACTSASLEPSYVLRALGVEDEMAHTSIRFGIGRFTTEQEIDHTIKKCTEHVTKLRDMSPLWEMVQEGIDLKSIQWASDH